MSLLISGTVTLDTIEVGDQRWDDVPGGSALYAAAAASRRGACRVLGVAGNDFPPACLEELVRAGIDVSGIVRRPGPTFRWHARYAPSLSERTTLARDPGVGGELPRIPPAWVAEPSAVLLGSTDPALQRAVLSALEQPTVVGVDTMHHWIVSRKQDLWDVIGDADLVFVSEREVQALGGSSSLGTAARAVLRAGPQAVVVKRAERGAWLLHASGQATLQPAVPRVSVTDPTGAGDAFAGGFMAVVAETGKLEFPTLKRAMAAGVDAAAAAIREVSWGGLVRSGGLGTL